MKGAYNVGSGDWFAEASVPDKTRNAQVSSAEEKLVSLSMLACLAAGLHR